MLTFLLLLQINVGVAISIPVSFSPGPAASSTSSVTATPPSASADGNSAIALTITARDAFNNAVGNANVNLSFSGGNNTITPPQGATNANGIFTAKIVSTQVQSNTVTAIFDSGASVAANINFFTGPISTSRSFLAVSPNSQIANNSNVIAATMTLKDAQGHPVSGQALSFTASGANTTITPSNPTDASGMSTVNYASNLAQSESAIVTIGSTAFSQPIVFVAGPPVSAASTLSVNPNASLYASGIQAATLTAVFADAFGNPASNVTVTWSASNGNNVFSPATGITNAAGVFTAQLTTTTAGSRLISANAGAAIATTTVSFVPGGYAPNSTFVASPNQITADGNTTSTLILTARDGNNELLPNAPVQLTDPVINHMFMPAGGATDANGIFVSLMTSTQAGSQMISARFAGAQLNTAIISAALSPACSATSFFGGPPWPKSDAQGGAGLVSADFNGDGNQDIAVLDFAGSVKILFGRGNQLFATPVVYGVGGASTALAIGDINGDGIVDLATCSAGSNTVSVLIGNPNGTFQPVTGAKTYAIGSLPRDIIILDFNGDGSPDIATTNQNSNNVSVLYNAGGGTFQS
jgi:hypothetical protein